MQTTYKSGRTILKYRVSFLASILCLTTLIFSVEARPEIIVKLLILSLVGICLLIPVGVLLFYAIDKKEPWNFHRKLMANREVVPAAVRQDGRLLEWASANLKANRDVVLAAVKQDVAALEYASDELKASIRADRDNLN